MFNARWKFKKRLYSSNFARPRPWRKGILYILYIIVVTSEPPNWKCSRAHFRRTVEDTFIILLAYFFIIYIYNVCMCVCVLLLISTIYVQRSLGVTALLSISSFVSLAWLPSISFRNVYVCFWLDEPLVSHLFLSLSMECITIWKISRGFEVRRRWTAARCIADDYFPTPTVGET